MIITRLLGGLGNQMFQYAAGLALAQQRRTVLKLDVSWFREYAEFEAHNQYGLSCFNVTEQFATQEEIERTRGIQLTHTEKWSVALARRLRFYQYSGRHSQPANHHVPPSFRFYPEFFAQPNHTYLDGMFQSEKFFQPIANILRLHFSFRYPAQPAVVAMAARIQSGPSAAVHFRRGDYVRNPQFSKEIGMVGLDYYYQAVSLLRERHSDVTGFAAAPAAADLAGALLRALSAYQAGRLPEMGKAASARAREIFPEFPEAAYVSQLESLLNRLPHVSA